MNTVRITAGGSPPSAAGLGAQIRLTELDATAHANESPSSTNTRFIYRFMCEGKMCVRILRPDQADRIKQIFHRISQELQSQRSEGVSSLTGRVTAINLVADLIEREVDGNKDSISLSSLEGENTWYEQAVNELVRIVGGKMVGSSLLEDRKSERARSPNQPETTHFCSIPGRFFGSTPIDLSHVGCTKEQTREDYLDGRWCKGNQDQKKDEVFTSELKTIKEEMQKQYRNQPLTREMEKECKIEARSRAVAVELLRTGSDEARIALFMKLTIENNLPCNTSLNLRTPLDQAMARKHLTLRGPNILHSVKLSARSSSEGESSLTEEDVVDNAERRSNESLASGGATERSSDASKISAVWQGQGASSGGGGLFSGLWNWMPSGRSDPEAADWLRTGTNAMVEGKGKAMSEDVDPADGFELAGLPDLRLNLAPDLRGSILGLEDTDFAKKKWTEFVSQGQAEEPLLQVMRNAASQGEVALKECLTKVLDESSTCKPDLLIHYLNQAVKKVPEQPSSRFDPNSLVAVLKEAWERGPGPSESKHPGIEGSKQVQELLSDGGFNPKKGGSGFGGDES
ncbi:MAG: hypothetical protein NT065_03115 [Chlamydiae bacterium]|nr:hypothetical protein [Chlamydiota bacterium]